MDSLGFRRKWTAMALYKSIESDTVVSDTQNKIQLFTLG